MSSAAGAPASRIISPSRLMSASSCLRWRACCRRVLVTDDFLEHSIRTAPILVVDDIATNVEMVTGLLNLGGFTEVSGATDPKKGLEMVRNERFDLLLLDMRMPEIDGIEFMKRLREGDRPDQPAVIVLTAQTDEETRRSALGAGA